MKFLFSSLTLHVSRRFELIGKQKSFCLDTVEWTNGMTIICFLYKRKLCASPLTQHTSSVVKLLPNKLQHILWNIRQRFRDSLLKFLLTCRKTGHIDLSFPIAPQNNIKRCQVNESLSSQYNESNKWISVYNIKDRGI